MDKILGLDPTEFTFTTLAFCLTITFIYFFTRQFWPWYTKIRWPAKQEQNKSKIDREFIMRQAKEQAELKMEMDRQIQQYEIQMKSLEVQQNIRDALIELKTLVSQNASSIGRVENAMSSVLETRFRNIEESIIEKEKTR